MSTWAQSLHHYIYINIMILIYNISLHYIVTNFGNFGMFEESPQLSTSGSAQLLVTTQSNKLLLLAAL